MFCHLDEGIWQNHNSYKQMSGRLSSDLQCLTMCPHILCTETAIHMHMLMLGLTVVQFRQRRLNIFIQTDKRHNLLWQDLIWLVTSWGQQSVQKGIKVSGGTLGYRSTTERWQALPSNQYRLCSVVQRSHLVGLTWETSVGSRECHMLQSKPHDQRIYCHTSRDSAICNSVPHWYCCDRLSSTVSLFGAWKFQGEILGILCAWASHHLNSGKHKAFCYVLYRSIGKTLALFTLIPYRNCCNHTSCSILPFCAIHSFTHLAVCCIFLPQPWILNQLGLSSENLW